MSIGEIISLLTLIGTLLLGFVGLIIEQRMNRKESFNKRVTEERIKWLNKVRDDYSKIMAALSLKKNSFCNKDSYNDQNEYNKNMYEAEIAKYDLISRLNTSTYEGNEYNKDLKDFLLKLSFSIGTETTLPKDEETKLFMIYMNLMLEKEWQKSKKETKSNV